MNRSPLFRIVPRILLAVIVLGSAGCAADPRYNKGLEWVVSQEQERQRLEKQGFPQYSSGM
jgi:hypothetical protein